MRSAFPSLVLAAALLLSACRAAPEANTAANAAAPQSGPLSTVPLQVETTGGERRAFTVEVAVSEAEQEHGLMAREQLAPDRGMVFPFALPKTASFWMKDTDIPLDLLFVRPNGTIAAVLNGVPDDLHPLSTAEPVSAVVEIAGGVAASLGIKAGDRVRWGDCRSEANQPGAMPDPLRYCPTSR